MEVDELDGGKGEDLSSLEERGLGALLLFVFWVLSTKPSPTRRGPWALVSFGFSVAYVLVGLLRSILLSFDGARACVGGSMHVDANGRHAGFSAACRLKI